MDRLYCKYACDLVEYEHEFGDVHYTEKDLTIDEKIQKIIGKNQLLVTDSVKENFESITDVKWCRAFVLDNKTVQWYTYVGHVKDQITRGEFDPLSEQSYIVDSIYRAMRRSAYL